MPSCSLPGSLETCSETEVVRKNETEEKDEKEEEGSNTAAAPDRSANQTSRKGRKCVTIALKKGMRGFGFKIDREQSDREGSQELHS